MTPRGAYASIVLLAVALLLCATRAGAEDSRKSFGRVAYRETVDGAGPAFLELVSATEAELLQTKGAAKVVVPWNLVRGPGIRLVLPGGLVRILLLKGKGVAALGEDHELDCVAGASWHASVLADSKYAGSPRAFFSAGRDGFVLHADGAADWWKDGGRTMLALRQAKRADGAMALTFPDGTTKTFRADSKGWQDVETKVTYAPEEDRSIRVTCLSNLSQLVQVFIVNMMENKTKAMKYDGIATPLSWRKTSTFIRRGQESVLFRCPGDPHLRALDEECRKAYDAVDLSNPPLDLCSYAFRDFKEFPLAVTSPDKLLIACCRQGRDGRTPHHRDGICVAFDDGSADFFPPEDLGLQPGEPIVVGPDSNVRLLRVVVQVPKR